VDIAGDIMPGIQMTVNALQIGRLVFTGIIKMSILPFLAQFRREKVLMAGNAGGFIHMFLSILQARSFIPVE
jgi:hypothetical protein